MSDQQAGEGKTELKAGEQKKPHVSPTQIDMLARCGEQWYRRYVKGEKIAPGIALVIGGATHASTEKQLRRKFDTQGDLPTVEEARAWAADSFEQKYAAEGVQYSADEIEEGVAAVKGRAKDTTISLAAGYLTTFAREITPARIEWPFRIETPWTHDVLGYVDVVDQRPNGALAIRDTKTKVGKKPSSSEADDSFQLSVYALAHQVYGGDVPVPVTLDFVVAKPKPTGTLVEPVRLVSVRTEHDMEVTVERINRAIEVIDRGVFMPARPNEWWCSRKFCGYYDSCKFAGGRTQVEVPAIAAEEREIEGAKLMGEQPATR
jgi:hypothetical protein